MRIADVFSSRLSPSRRSIASSSTNPLSPNKEAQIKSGPVVGSTNPLSPNKEAQIKSGPVVGSTNPLSPNNEAQRRDGPIVGSTNPLSPNNEAQRRDGPIVGSTNPLSPNKEAQIKSGPVVGSTNPLSPNQEAQIKSGPVVGSTNPLSPNQEAQIKSGPVGGLNTFSVKSGDTLTSIAEKEHVSLSSLEAANPQITNDNLIYPGQKISLPSGASESTSQDGGASKMHSTINLSTVATPPPVLPSPAKSGVVKSVVAKLSGGSSVSISSDTQAQTLISKYTNEEQQAKLNLNSISQLNKTVESDQSALKTAETRLTTLKNADNAHVVLPNNYNPNNSNPSYKSISKSYKPLIQKANNVVNDDQEKLDKAQAEINASQNSAIYNQQTYGSASFDVRSLTNAEDKLNLETSFKPKAYSISPK